ncbi:MAG TPA: hypothetical protein VIP11_04210 [Gemmatimonadaceae bacterium]
MTDPLMRHVRTDHSVELPVLGHVTRFESNSGDVLERVHESFGGWRVVQGIEEQSQALRIRIIVFDGDEPGPRPIPVRHLTPDVSRVVIHSPGSFAISDPQRREAIAYVTTTLVADHELFRTAVLEAATLALLSHFDRHPIHASAIARNNRAVLLAGASGAGKSTLAHLAHGAGFDVLSEDHVWIQLAPCLRVWGRPGHARLLDGDGDRKSVVALAGANRISCHVADAATLCVLDRGSRPSLERLDASAIVDFLTRDIAPGFDRFPERNLPVANALAGSGGWRLTLTSDPRDALPFLEEMLNQA